MAFDYGSIDLGLKNPFKKEGAVNTVRGVVVSILGVYLLIVAAGKVEQNMVVAWITVVFGLGLLGSGLNTASGGIIAMMRYFVGRNHPTSLAYNHSPSESSTANEEAPYVAYNKQNLIEMMVGRKNSTFIEPHGFLARFIHSVFPRLTYMPYPVRNMAQQLAGSWIKTLVAFIAYGFVAFVSLSGFAGETGKLILPIYSVILTLYLLLIWREAGSAIKRTPDKTIVNMGNMALVQTLAGAILLPVIIGVILQFSFDVFEISSVEMKKYAAYLPQSDTFLYLLMGLLGAVLTTLIISVMLKKRLNYADPKVEVSELRENWQESVHPNEIFINLDNLVMANRRYKEVPNRVYQELDPSLNEQVEGKGKFYGEMIQEIQPKFKPMDLGNTFIKARLISLITGNALLLICSFITFFLAFNVADAYTEISPIISNGHDFLSKDQTDLISSSTESIIHLFLAGMFIRAFAHILTHSAHLFFAEMQFESDLIYFKIEGTFTESKISTGTSIHDSTRSENTLIRSSITPWVIVSRLITSTFAATGIRNLEYPRHILEMHKNDLELAEIRKDIIGFLKDRESIASITSERDLYNASQIHQINQQSRAAPEQTQDALTRRNQEAGGYLRQEQERNISENTEGM